MSEMCRHVWVAGMMYVSDEDVAGTAEARKKFGGTVECERCEVEYAPGMEYEWEE